MASPVELLEQALAERERDPRAATELFQRSAAGFAGLGDPLGRGRCLFELSRIASRRGDVREAWRLSLQALDCLRGTEPFETEACLWTAELALASDDEASATQQLLAAERSARGPCLVRVQRTLGQLAFDRGDLDEAERRYLAAWRHAAELSACESARLRQCFAELALARGRMAECRAQLEAALAHLAGSLDRESLDLGAHVRVELADLLAHDGAVALALPLYDAALQHYEQTGLGARARRIARRRDALAKFTSRAHRGP